MDIYFISISIGAFRFVVSPKSPGAWSSWWAVGAVKKKIVVS